MMRDRPKSPDIRWKQTSPAEVYGFMHLPLRDSKLRVSLRNRVPPEVRYAGLGDVVATIRYRFFMPFLQSATTDEEAYRTAAKTQVHWVVDFCVWREAFDEPIICDTLEQAKTVVESLRALKEYDA